MMTLKEKLVAPPVLEHHIQLKSGLIIEVKMYPLSISSVFHPLQTFLLVISNQNMKLRRIRVIKLLMLLLSLRLPLLSFQLLLPLLQLDLFQLVGLKKLK